ncbi:metallopeptidase family protein [Chloroflexota bacterium]
MNRDRFEQLVAKAVETLPDEFLERLENIVVAVEDYPTSDQLTRAGVKRGKILLGLYEGVPLTKRGRYYSLVSPDYITIFKKPIESKCGDDDAITTEIQRVVQHEIAHHFGIGDARLKQIEKAKIKHKGKAI